jgi:hypothetical protein
MKQVVSCTDHNKRKHSVEMFFKAIFNPIFGDRRGEREREREREEQGRLKCSLCLKKCQPTIVPLVSILIRPD